MSIRFTRKLGWWLAGICVTITAFALLVLLPTIKHAIEVGNFIQCNSNLKQIGGALNNYRQEYGVFPPAYLQDKNGKPTVSWRVLILPYGGGDDLYSQIRLDEPWNSPHNLRFAPLMPEVYRCPAEKGARKGDTSYVAVVGEKTLWPGATTRPYPETIGSILPPILVVECRASGISWMEPRDLSLEVAAKGVIREAKSGIVACHPCSNRCGRIKGVDCGPKSWVYGNSLFGANCLFADGFVYCISEQLSPQVLMDLLTTGITDQGKKEKKEGKQKGTLKAPVKAGKE